MHNCRNRAIFEAKGEIIGYLDDDMYLDCDWLCSASNVSDFFPWIGGKVLPAWETNQKPDWLKFFWDEKKDFNIFSHLGLIDLGNEKKVVSANFIFGGNCFIQKKILFKFGGFNPDMMPNDLIAFRGDGETGLSDKYKNANYKALYIPKMIVYHRISDKKLTIDYLKRRSFAEGISRSYSEIRNNYFYNKHKPNSIILILRAIKRKVLSFVKLIFICFGTKSRFLKNVIFINIKESSRNGKKFYKNSIKKNPILLKWILKKDYLDFEDVKKYKIKL